MISRYGDDDVGLLRVAHRDDLAEVGHLDAASVAR